MSTAATIRSAPAWWRRRAAGHAALLLAALGALLLLAAVTQTQFGILGHRKWPLPAAKKIKTDVKAYKVHLPGWATGPLAERRARLLKDGQPIGSRAVHTATVVRRGNGWFRIQGGYLYFSLLQNRDPRPEIDRFSLSAPRPIKPMVWVAAGLLLGFGGAGVLRNRYGLEKLVAAWQRVRSVPAAALIIGVFLIALIARVAQWQATPEFSDGCFSVKNVPYSDAFGWDQLATNMAAGRGFSGGFSAQRPIYPVMLGFLYVFTGQSVAVAKVLNFLWIALAAASVCGIGVLAGSRLAGLAGALVIILGEDYLSFSQVLLTETLGVAFGASAVFALCLALEKPGWSRIVLAALLLACATLASGFGLFALIGYGLIALVTWWRRQGTRAALVQSVVLAGVVQLAWTPWLLRQHAVHGIWNLSPSGADLMYAAAAPEHGKLSPEIATAWQEAGIPNEEGARYQFYMHKFGEAVRADPSGYLKGVLHGMANFAAFWKFEGSQNFGVVLLALIGAAVAKLWGHDLWSALAASVVVIAAYFALRGNSAGVVWPVASLLALATCRARQRPLWALVAVTAPFVALLAGMTGGNLGRRMWTACDWTMPLLLVVGGSGAIRVLADGIERLAARLRLKFPHAALRSPESSIISPSPFEGAVAGTMPGLFLLGHAALATLTLTGLWLAKRHHRTPLQLPADVRAEAHKHSAKHFDFLAGIDPGDTRFWVGAVEFHEYAARLRAWEDVNHFARSFEMRPYTRTVAFPKQLEVRDGGVIACQVRTSPRELPRDRPLLLVGVRNHDPKAHLGQNTTMVEVLGFAPLDAGTAPATVEWEQFTSLPFTREAFDILAAKR